MAGEIVYADLTIPSEPHASSLFHPTQQLNAPQNPRWHQIMLWIACFGIVILVAIVLFLAPSSTVWPGSSGAQRVVGASPSPNSAKRGMAQLWWASEGGGNFILTPSPLLRQAQHGLALPGVARLLQGSEGGGHFILALSPRLHQARCGPAPVGLRRQQALHLCLIAPAPSGMAWQGSEGVRNVNSMSAASSPVNSICQICPPHWHFHQDKCYWVSTDLKSWHESRSDCSAKGAQLVIIHNKEEKDFLKRITENGQSYWIGLSLSSTEKKWVWITGHPLDQNLFQDLPSSAGDGCCAGIKNGKIQSDTCTAIHRWVCQKDPILL
ncbi:CD209 antigen-like [Eublepharis macularius]|uniref:CD209 antigen-like n=1 Tax=Eublepharis macularius TaxID=481883 RepID=A0AA97J7S1_EUBMA|nr:CD209 antigen-like [Eublepharis macularius]